MRLEGAGRRSWLMIALTLSQGLVWRASIYGQSCILLLYLADPAFHWRTETFHHLDGIEKHLFLCYLTS